MFPSKIKELATQVPLPEFKKLRILMMPIVFGDNNTVPDKDLIPMLDVMWAATPEHKGKTVYLTVDQKNIPAGTTHRRPGLHVDGYPHTLEDKYYFGNPGIWAGHAHGGSWGGGGCWGGGSKSLYWHTGTGLLTISDIEGCRAWNQDFTGEPKVEGDCEHLRNQCLEENAITLKPNVLYWMNPACVHESLKMEKDTKRTFVRLSLPSQCDWYNGCTPNPLGVKPAGKTSRRRKFMDVA